MHLNAGGRKQQASQLGIRSTLRFPRDNIPALPMRISINNQRNTNDKNQQPGHDIPVHKRATGQRDAQQSKPDIRYCPMVLGAC